MSTPIKINKGLKEKLSSLDILDGQINFCTDTGELYIDNDSKRTIISSMYYGETETSEETQVKIIPIDGFSLKTGARIIIKFIYGNSATNPKLNINDTGEKDIVYSSANKLELLEGVSYDFVYNGTDYILIGNSSGIATNDKDGNEITATYATKAELANATSVIIRRWAE